MELKRITDADADDNGNMIVRTQYTDYGLMAETTRKYRVRAENMPEIGMLAKSEESEHAEATTDAAMAPGMPTALTADAVSDTQIDLEWMAPAETGGADIIGYVLDRKSGDGDFMTIAATNEAAWWNALDCPMMNDAVEDHVGDGPAVGPDNMTSPYCALYDGLSDAAEAVVDRAFAASGYATIMATSHMDMGLDAETPYTYQVKAVNSAGASMPSAEQSATTDRSNVAPEVASAIDDQMVTAGESVDVDVSANFSDPDGDDLTITAMSSNTDAATVSVSGSTVTVMGEAAGTSTITVTATDTGNMAGMLSVSQMFDVTVNAAVVVPTNNDPTAVGSIGAVTVTAGMSDTMDISDYFDDADDDTLTYTATSDMEMYATVSVDGSMVTITGVAAGSAIVTVTASDGMGGMDATQTIMVTVEAARVAPSNVVINPVGSGLINVQWTPVPGAHGYYIVAAEASVGGDVHSEAINGQDVSLGSIGGLTKDVDYLIFIGAFFTVDDYVLEYVETVTAE